MTCEFEDWLAGFDVPDADGSVFAGGDQLQAIGTKRDRVDAAAVSDEHSFLFAGRHLIQADAPVPTARRDRLAVGGESETVHEMSRKLTLQLPGGGVPDSDRLVPGTGGDQRAVGAEGRSVNAMSVPVKREDFDSRFDILNLAGRM